MGWSTWLRETLPHAFSPRWIRRITAFLWFVFVALILGQLGPIIVVFNGWWLGGDISSLIENQALTGSLVVFSSTLLASSAYFLVREYIYKDYIENRTVKSFLVLIAILFVLLGTLATSNILMAPSRSALPSVVYAGSDQSGSQLHSKDDAFLAKSSAAHDGQNISRRQLTFHWTVYFLSIMVSICFWLMEDRDSAERFLRDIEANSRSLENRAASQSEIGDGVRI